MGKSRQILLGDKVEKETFLDEKWKMLDFHGNHELWSLVLELSETTKKEYHFLSTLVLGGPRKMCRISFPWNWKVKYEISLKSNAIRYIVWAMDK